jgi:hypothetical protein
VSLAAFAIVGIGSADAAVVVSSTATRNTAGGNASSFTFSGFNLGAGNALAVVINSETTTGTPSFGVTFNGSAVTSNVFTNSGAQGAGIFWVINPSSTSGDVVVSLGQTSNAAVTVLSLGGVTGVTDTASGTAANSTAFNLTYDGVVGGLVVVGGIDNTSAGGSSTPSITGTNFPTDTTQYTQRLTSNFQPSVSSSAIAQRYGAIAASGLDFTATFDPAGTGSSTRNAAALVAFTDTAVPEPATISLMGVAAIGLLARRRRA